MKKTTIGILLALYAIMSCNTINEIKFQAQADCAIDTLATFPFNYIKKLIVVDATINTSDKPNKFIFDTGAFQSKIAYNLAQALHLSTVARRNNGTAQGIKREIEIANLDAVKLSTAAFFNIAAGKLKYDSKSYSPCIAEDGIIGANLIQLAHWKINYQKKEITISTTPIFPDKDKGFVQIDFNTSFLSGVPKIDIEIEGQIIRDVVFDLGYNGGLVVPYSFAHTFQSTNTQTIADQSTSGIFGSNKDNLLVKELNVKLGGVRTKIPVEFSSLNKALLGNDFLEHFTLYLNYKDDNITLEPISSVEIDEVKNFIPGVLNDSLWIVNRTHPQIPLELGDTLTTINGYQPQDLFESHCDYFLNISRLLNANVLSIETINGNKIQLTLHN